MNKRCNKTPQKTTIAFDWFALKKKKSLNRNIFSIRYHFSSRSWISWFCLFVYLSVCVGFFGLKQKLKWPLLLKISKISMLKMNDGTRTHTQTKAIFFVLSFDHMISQTHKSNGKFQKFDSTYRYIKKTQTYTHTDKMKKVRYKNAIYHNSDKQCNFHLWANEKKNQCQQQQTRNKIVQILYVAEWQNYAIKITEQLFFFFFFFLINKWKLSAVRFIEDRQKRINRKLHPHEFSVRKIYIKFTVWNMC